MYLIFGSFGHFHYSNQSRQPFSFYEVYNVTLLRVGALNTEEFEFVYIHAALDRPC